MSPRRRSGALFAATLLASCGASTPRYPAELVSRTARRFPRLSDAPVRAELTLPFAQLFDNPRQQRAPLGTFEVPAARFASPVALTPIGNFSRALCSYPKLALSLPGRSGPHTRLFLTPHCADGARHGDALPDERSVARHYAAYVLQRALGLPALRVSLARLRYRDSGSRRAIDGKPALLIEDLADLRRRLAPRAPAPAARWRDLDRDAVARFHLFQILINNPDWRLLELEPLSDYARDDPAPALHNTALVARAGRRVPVAFDFDLSSLSGVPQTVRSMTRARYRQFLEQIINPRFLSDEPPLLRWMVVRLQHFRRRHPAAAARRAVAHFLRREPALLAALAGLPADAAAVARQHLQAFTAALKQHERYPHVLTETPLYRDRERRARACARVAVGAPLQLLAPATADGLLRVRLIQYRVPRGAGRTPAATCSRAGRAATPDEGWIAARALSGPAERR